MGVWDALRSTTGKLFNRKVADTPPDTSENKYSYYMVVTQIGDAIRSNVAEKLKEYIPDPDDREKISQIVSKLGKLAVESAVNESLKGVTGAVQVYKIVKEGLKDQPPLNSSNEGNKPDPRVSMEEMQARIEKLEEDVNYIKQQSNISIQSAEGSEPSKEFPDEPIKGSASPRKEEFPDEPIEGSASPIKEEFPDEPIKGSASPIKEEFPDEPIKGSACPKNDPKRASIRSCL